MSNPFLDSPPKSDLNLPDADSTNPFAVDDINESTSIDLKKDSFEDDFLTNFDKVSMQADKNELIKYVDAKIKAIKDEAVHKITEKTNVQYTLLILYLISLKIKEVTESRCSDAKEVALQKLELLKFFARPDVLEVCKEHWVTVSKIMKEKSCSSSRLFLAQKFNDNEVITDMLCQDGNFEKALMHVLKIKDRHLFMKFSPQFIQFIPDLFVEQFKNCPLNVRANIDDYLKILYTLAENKERVNLALRYLEWSYDNDLGCEEAFNLHIGLTAQAEPSNLLKLLQKLSMKRPVQFDLRFALFVSERADQYKCASLVYGLMGLWERAVSVCLDNDDYQEAEECAIKMASFSTNDISTSFLFEGALFGEEGESEFDFEKPSEITQKKVWLRLANLLIKESPDAAIKKCVALIGKSNGVFTFKDIVPLFSTLSSIADFKEALRQSLSSYREKSEKLKNEMKSTIKTNQSINIQLQKLQKRMTVVRPTDKCQKCDECALSKPFYVFNCKHIFHDLCLEQMYSDEHQLEVKTPPTTTDESGKRHVNTCPLCGLNVIESLDKPFFTQETYLAELESW